MKRRYVCKKTVSNAFVWINGNVAKRLFVVLELVLLGRDSVALFELGGEILFVAKSQHVRNAPNGVIAVSQPLLCHLQDGTHDVLVDGLLVGGFKHTAGIDGGDVKMIRHVCGAEILAQVFVDVDPHLLGQRKVLLFHLVEVFGHLVEHGVEDRADLFQVVFCVQLHVKLVVVFGQIHVSDHNGLGKAKGLQKLGDQISRDVDPDLVVGMVGVGMILVIGKSGDQIGVSLCHPILFPVTADVTNS